MTGNAPATRMPGEQLTIALIAHVDCGNAAALSDRIQALLAAGDTGHVTIDLTGLEFCDSAGVRVFKHLHRMAADRGVTMTLRHPRPHIRWLLQALDATDLLDRTTTSPG